MSAVTKYEGPRPGNAPLSDEEAERLRQRVPDDPVRLPEHALPCGSCGIAVAVPPEPEREPLPVKSGELVHQKRPQYARCTECQRIHDTAAEYVAAHPLLAARIGKHVAVERIESVLCGMAILGKPVTGTDLALLLPRMHPPSHRLRFSDPLATDRGRCSPRPWAHVSLTQRAELRKAYADYLRDRLVRSEPDVPVRCPSGGCLLCGVSSVSRSALEVARRGGPDAAATVAWSPVTTTRIALGRPGPDLVSGHVCPSCRAAIDASNGAIGQTAIGNAVLAHVARTSPARAQRLRNLLEDDFPPVLLGWGAIGKAPNPEPFWHLVKVLDRL